MTAFLAGCRLLFAQADPYGMTERIPNTSLIIVSSGDTLADMRLRRVFEALPFRRPVFLTHAGDGSERLFLVEKAGRILVFENDETTDTYRVFLDIRDRVNAEPSEAGLLSMAFHPLYPDSQTFYVYYTSGNLLSRVSEFRVSDDPDAADAASERVILQVGQPATNHNGGQIAFGPDEYLYIGLGDGGSGGDPWGNAQNRANLLGTILRIDVDRHTASSDYEIPGDNPFFGNTEGWRPEIWAWGLRNPWRFSFDRQTGDLWTGDVGQNAWEEVDLIRKGRNYGWNRMEGFHCYPPGSSCDTTGLALPVVEYSHDTGRSITGGYVYRGSRLPRLSGVYLYGDYVTRTIWGLKVENGAVKENKIIAESPSPVSSFGEGEDGEIYVLGYEGYMFVPEEKPDTPPARPVPESISVSGLFSNIAAKTFAEGLIPYTVNSQLWSDGAAKTRLLALPDTSKIVFSRDGIWQFPPGAVIVKNFYLDMVRNDPGSRKIIETRFLVRRETGEGWDGFSYLWNDEETDAVLLDSSTTRTFHIQAGDSMINQSYYYPGRSQCLVCHTPVTGYVLGLKTAQINKTHIYETGSGPVSDNQLRSMNHIRLFTEDTGDAYTGFPALPDPYDESITIVSRARSYMDANCANCHVPGGSGRTNMDLRFRTPLDSANVYDLKPVFGNMNQPDAALIKPGRPDLSVVYLRMTDTGEFRMPPLATSVVDEYGSRLIAQWIDSLGIDTTSVRSSKAVPDGFRLYPAFPNPFNASTTIRYTVALPGHIQLKIFDLLGREVCTLVNGFRTADTYTVVFDSRDHSSGIYLVTLQADQNRSDTRKMLLLK